jgi:soluble cytochrome b562
MKITKSLLVAALTAFAFSSASFADETPLGKEMSTMNKAYKALKKNAADASKKADNLEALAKIKKSLEASIPLEPKHTKDQPAAAKPAYLEKYKKQMQELIAAFDEVKKGIEAGNDAAVKAAFDKLSDLKKKGHEDFGADD